jgi:protein SCO1/2
VTGKVRRFLLLLFCVVFALGSCGSQDFRGSVLEEPLAVPNFSLHDEEGGTFRLSDQRGNVVLLFFGYTQCPDVCPTTLATWRRVHEILGDDAERVRFVFVTVDPERDTVERLALHVNAFNPEFIGLTGSQDELEAVYQVFNIVHEKDTSSGSAAGYLINHTATAFVIDPEGLWRLRETYGTEAEDIAHDIQLLLD